MKTSAAKQRGLSLLEVLIAFTILSMALGVVLLGYSHGLRNVGVSSDYQRALTLAQNQLAAVTVEMPLEVGVRRGESESFRWALIVEPWEDLKGNYMRVAQRLYKLRVEVAWGEGQRMRHVSLESLRLSREPQ